MAISSKNILTRSTIAPLLFLISFLTLSQSQLTPTTPLAPTMAECGPRLLVLSPCAPFVEGQSPGPSAQCCNNLLQVYNLERSCLCLFLNSTALASLPINNTLALQLPGLCNPQIVPSTCSASGGSPPSTISAPPTSPNSPATLTMNPTPDAAGAPTITIAPRPSTARYGFKNSSANKLAGCQWEIAVAVIFLLLEKLF